MLLCPGMTEKQTTILQDIVINLDHDDKVHRASLCMLVNNAKKKCYCISHQHQSVTCMSRYSKTQCAHDKRLGRGENALGVHSPVL